MSIPVSKFGKDHWSLLVFVETRCVDYKGKLDRRRMRCNPNTHTLNAHSSNWTSDTDSTVLKNGNVELGHDDWDCLDDLENAGFLEVVSVTQGFVKLTNLGISTAHALRTHKIQGGRFSTFEFKPERMNENNDSTQRTNS